MKRRHTSDRITALALISAVILSISGCAASGSDSLYALGIRQYSLFFDEYILPQNSAADTDLVSPGTPSGQSAAPVSESRSSGQPLYAAYSYYLPNLQGSEADNFYAVYNGIMNFEETITLPHPVSSPEISDIMSLLNNECPELLQLDSKWMERTNIMGNVVAVSPVYIIDKETFANQLSSVEMLITQWQTELTGKDVFDAELAIYNYIINACRYSTEAEFCQSAFGALINGSAKCDGRAKALVWGLRSLGVTASVLTGSSHAWVVARIGNYDYNIDPTYDDNEQDSVQLPTCYASFNVPESFIADDPYPVDDFFVRRGYPATDHLEENYHVRTGTWITPGQSSRTLFDSQLMQAFTNGSGLINIRYASHEDFLAAKADSQKWIQSFINQTHSSCNIVSYDYDAHNLLVIHVSFS